MAMMARALSSKASPVPYVVNFARSLDESCTSTSSSASVCAILQSPRYLRTLLSQNLHLGRGKRSPLLRASAFSSASSSFQGRLCLVLTCPIDEVREGKRTGVQASLLGVGAPEALVIGVVALLVFGPKGLAEVARTLGKSLRAFQPTIKELQQVSREFKATLEQEMGLDELRNPSNDPPPKSNPSPPSSISLTPTFIPSTLSAADAADAAEARKTEASAQPKLYTTEDYVQITEDQTNALVSKEQHCKASEATAWGGSSPVNSAGETSSEGQEWTSTDSTIIGGRGGEQVGSTPTRLIEKPSDNGSPKPMCD